MKRVAAAALVGLFVGAGIWGAVNSLPQWDPRGFWGLFFGGFAAVATFGLTLMLLSRHARRLRLIGRWVSIATLVLFGLLVCFFPYGAFSHSPFSPEGLWLYPLGLSPLIVAVWLVWAPRWRARPGPWDAPSGPETLG